MGVASLCKECLNKYHQSRYKKNPGLFNYRVHSWNSQNPGYRLFISAKKRAEKRGLSFCLTKDWFEEKVDAGVCELTGVPFRYETNSPWRPSPDRINNEFGYEPWNTRMILLGLNRLKNSHSEKVFKEFLSDIARVFYE